MLFIHVSLLIDVIIVIVLTKRLIVKYYSCLSYYDHGWHKKDQTSIIITYCYCSMICCIRFGSSFIIFHHFLLSGWPATKATLAMPQRCPRSNCLCWHSGRNMRIDELSVPSHMSLLYYINNWYKCCCSCHHFWIYYEFDLLSFYTILHHSTSLLHLAILSWVGQCCNPITSQVGSNDFRRP